MKTFLITLCLIGYGLATQVPTQYTNGGSFGGAAGYATGPQYTQTAGQTPYQTGAATNQIGGGQFSQYQASANQFNAAQMQSAGQLMAGPAGMTVAGYGQAGPTMGTAQYTGTAGQMATGLAGSYAPATGMMPTSYGATAFTGAATPALSTAGYGATPAIGASALTRTMPSTIGYTAPPLPPMSAPMPALMPPPPMAAPLRAPIMRIPPAPVLRIPPPPPMYSTYMPPMMGYGWGMGNMATNYMGLQSFGTTMTSYPSTVVKRTTTYAMPRVPTFAPMSMPSMYSSYFPSASLSPQMTNMYSNMWSAYSGTPTYGMSTYGMPKYGMPAMMSSAMAMPAPAMTTGAATTRLNMYATPAMNAARMPGYSMGGFGTYGMGMGKSMFMPGFMTPYPGFSSFMTPSMTTGMAFPTIPFKKAGKKA